MGPTSSLQRVSKYYHAYQVIYTSKCTQPHSHIFTTQQDEAQECLVTVVLRKEDRIRLTWPARRLVGVPNASRSPACGLVVIA